jgi:hypothetical protein
VPARPRLSPSESQRSAGVNGTNQVSGTVQILAMMYSRAGPSPVSPSPVSPSPVSTAPDSDRIWP